MSGLLEEFQDGDGRGGFHVWCPGCVDFHALYVTGEGRPRWNFNGDMDKPTFDPSLRVRWDYGDKRESRVCHSFIRNGQWQFLSD